MPHVPTRVNLRSVLPSTSLFPGLGNGVTTPALPARTGEIIELIEIMTPSSLALSPSKEGGLGSDSFETSVAQQTSVESGVPKKPATQFVEGHEQGNQ